jgi:hypothetical protein
MNCAFFQMRELSEGGGAVLILEPIRVFVL